MRDIMQQVDNSLQIQVPNRTVKNLDSQTLTTTKFGLLTPTYFLETVPGAEYTIGCEVLTRFAPINSPLMHKCTQKTMFFYVPNRIIWDNWESFIMKKPDPLTGLTPICPNYPASYLDRANAPNGVSPVRLADYFGLKKPSTAWGSLATVSLNPFMYAAYQAIYSRWFRHKIVEPEVDYKLQDGVVSLDRFNNILTVPRVATFEDDYFNSVLPTPQKGSPAVVTDNAPVIQNISDSETFKRLHAYMGSSGASDSGTFPKVLTESISGLDNSVDNQYLYAQVSMTVEQIRVAAVMQRYLEASNHVGNYIDYLKMFFDVTFPDSRAQQPEYIGGTSSPIQISDVMNTADDQGRIVGNGVGYNQGDSFKYTSLEHGMIIGLTFITYKPTYFHAKSKMHLKLDPHDFFNPLFDSLGEQALLDGELNEISNAARDTFGYVPHHAEYRNSFDYVTGEMATTYSHWHLARAYQPNLTLTASFYKILDERRIFQVDDDDFDPILLQVYNNIKAYLPMGSHSTPTIQ